MNSMSLLSQLDLFFLLLPSFQIICRFDFFTYIPVAMHPDKYTYV
jgi:hypothetical protein